jgi:hypothetical protein
VGIRDWFRPAIQIEGRDTEAEGGRFVGRFRGRCDRDDYKGPWRTGARSAMDDAAEHTLVRHWHGDRRGGQDRRGGPTIFGWKPSPGDGGWGSGWGDGMW